VVEKIGDAVVSCKCVTDLLCVLQSTQFTSRVINRLWMMLYNSDVNAIIIITIDAAGAEFLHYIIV